MLKGYLEALKPERTFFNVMMAAAGFLFASRWHIDWKLALATIVGTSLLVISGCLSNNATDAQLDTRMPRTKKRGSATGMVPVPHLVLLASISGVVGLCILALRVNLLTTLLGVVAYVDYVVLYGWTKRITPWSTLVGTAAGALPLMAGYTAVSDQLSSVVWLLGLVMLCWQMVHFYAIGIYRLKDYKAGNLPIWPVRYGIVNTQRWMLVYTALYLLAVALLIVFGSMGYVFTMAVGAIGLYWLWIGLRGLRLDAPEKWARHMFGFSLSVLLVLAFGVAISPLLP